MPPRPSHAVFAAPLLLLLGWGPLIAQQAPGVQSVTFINKAVEAGVDELSYGRGAAMVDLDGDGRLDLVATNSLMDNGFFRQRPDHGFDDAIGAWSVPQDTLHHWAIVVADLDNDGDPDIYFANGGRTDSEPNQLLRNDIDQATHAGAFVDVTAMSGAASFVAPSFGVTSLDYDLDGTLDLFVANSAIGAGSTCNLLHNDGGLGFTDTSAAAGITQPGNYRHPGAGDIDNDGWPDIGVGAYNSSNRLYRNQQDGTFVDIAAAAGLAEDGDTDFGWVFADYDNDGWMDVYLPKLNSALGTPSRVFLNNHDMTFSIGAEFGVHQDMGHNSMDVDSDGFPDVYIGTGNPAADSFDYLFKMTSTLPGQVLAQDISASSGILAMGMTRCHGIAFGDYDDDGDIDVYTNNGGPSGPTLEHNFLWQNQGTGNNWVGLDLVGTASNRGAIGTRSVATTASGRRIWLLRSAGQGFGNSDSPTQHFGLGTEQSVERIDVHWPSGIEQVLLSPQILTRHTMVETGLLISGGPAVPGATVLMEAYGEPGYKVALLAAPGLGPDVPLPKHGGIFQLDAGSTIWPLPAFPLDDAGVAKLPLTIPALAGLSGVTVYFQAWVHPNDSTSDDVITNVAPLVIG